MNSFNKLVWAASFAGLLLSLSAQALDSDGDYADDAVDLCPLQGNLFGDPEMLTYEGCPTTHPGIRQKIIKVLAQVEAVKTFVEESYHSGGVEGLYYKSEEWNQSAAANGGIPYTTSVYITQFDGAITVELDTSSTTGIPQLVGANVIILTPSIITSGTSQGLYGYDFGPIVWACEGNTNITAVSSGLYLAGAGTVPPRYLPPECQ